MAADFIPPGIEKLQWVWGPSTQITLFSQLRQSTWRGTVMTPVDKERVN
jgi:hypothetical protein